MKFSSMSSSSIFSMSIFSTLTLGDVWSINFEASSAVMSEILAKAQGEHGLESYIQGMKELWNGFEIEFTGLPNNPATKCAAEHVSLTLLRDLPGGEPALDREADSAAVHFGPVDGDPEEVDLPPGHLPGQHRHREPAASGVQEVPDGGRGGARTAQEVAVQAKGHRSAEL
ncbi:hypothetical protein OIY81_3375 [Cryptosporidium canis]|nr:hypothetical protein OIY81_3375 [Cryptosporidium canis]